MKQLSVFADRNSFRIEGRQAWGNYKGFPFTVANNANSNELVILASISLADPESEQRLNSRLAGLQAAKEFREMQSDRGSIVFKKRKAFSQISAQEIETFLDHLTGAFTEVNAKPGCFYCHREGTADYASYNGINLPMCDECFQSISSNVDKNLREYEEKSNNYAGGFFGALLGALVGSAVWIIVGLLGYVAAIAGLAISAASAKGYRMFGGKVTKGTLIIIGLCSLFALLVAQSATYSILLLREAGNQGIQANFLDSANTVVWLILNDSDFMGAFLKDLLLGLLFMGLGTYGTFRNILFAAKSPAGEVKRI